jgi:Leucine-rich repeat (LRR) protein
MAAGGGVVPGLDTLSSTDRGFVTWVAGMLREPVEALWASLCAANTRVEGHRIVALDLTPIGRALRDRLGPRALQLPMAGLVVTELDVSGLDLDVLDVRLLPQLRTLRCADNRIQAIDLSQNAALQVFDCTGNRLMLLELPQGCALEELRCAGNPLAVLTLPASGALRVLDASRNQLMVLDLPTLPALRELNLYRNALVRFSLRAAPLLEHLDLGRNELDEITLPPLPALRWLSVARNKLDHLQLGAAPALTELKCHGNYLEALDVRTCPRLVRIEGRANQIRTLLVDEDNHLEELDLSDNRLESFRVRCPRLEVLRAGGNELSELQCAGLPRLVQLDLNENVLGALELAGAPELVELRCAGNRLAELDLRPAPNLTRVHFLDTDGRGPAVMADEAQLHRLPELRALHHLGTGATQPADMDAFELHALASSLIFGRESEARLLEVAAAPRCDLGTLLMVYWTSAPHYYLKYADRSEVPEFERVGWDLLAGIERRVLGGAYDSHMLRFDPRLDRQTRTPRGVDWTVDDRLVKGPQRREIPAALFATSG